MYFFSILSFVVAICIFVVVVKNYIDNQNIDYGFKRKLTAEEARKKVANSENKIVAEFIDSCLTKVDEESEEGKYETSVSTEFFSNKKIIEKVVENLKSRGFEVKINYTDTSKEFVEYITLKW